MFQEARERVYRFGAELLGRLGRGGEEGDDGGEGVEGEVLHEFVFPTNEGSKLKAGQGRVVASSFKASARARGKRARGGEG